MKYMLMMCGTRSGWESMATWSRDDIRAHIAFMMDLNRKLSANGELVAAEGLAMPNEAVIVRAGPDGTPVTDGVFPESKEFLAGYWIVDVETTDRAIAIAAEASAAPGLGGRPLNIPIEMRQVMSGPPDDLL